MGLLIVIYILVEYFWPILFGLILIIAPIVIAFKISGKNSRPVTKQYSEDRLPQQSPEPENRTQKEDGEHVYEFDSTEDFYDQLWEKPETIDSEFLKDVDPETYYEMYGDK